jgi:thymidylate synthase ThyX
MEGDYSFPIDLNEREQEIVKPFFTNQDKHIFGLINLPEVVKGTLFSRYSRSEKSARRLLLDEFIPNKEVMEVIEANAPHKGLESALAVNKAEEFYQRVLVGYGDDSVAELASGHLACENISSLGADLITDSRIGFAFLEKSARYIPFDKQVGGKWLWYREPNLMESKFGDEYERTSNKIFELYSKWLPQAISYIKEVTPKDADATDRAYNSAVRAKACDILKNMLTAGRLTNLGLMGNGRAYEYLITKLYSSEVPEGQRLAKQIHEEMAKVMPSFVKRSQESEYITGTRSAMQDYMKRNNHTQKAEKVEKAYVRLVDYDKNAEVQVIAGMLFPYSQLPIESLKQAAEKMSPEQRKELEREYLSKRRNRRDKPGRGLENTFYTFELCSSYGAYRDIHRHRILTLDKQRLTTDLGYETPVELDALNLKKEYQDLMEEISGVYHRIAAEMPIEAQYMVPRASLMRYYLKLNLREVYHFTELRSTKQGHPDYRKIAQQMKILIEKVHPSLVEYMQVDMNDYALARMDSEKRIDRKLAEMDKKTESTQQ